jgi:hypothetical protein
VDDSVLDPKIAYIQVTHVTPHYCKDELESRQNEFEQNHDVDTFMYETPFTKSGGPRGDVENQWKRRTILRSEKFPHFYDQKKNNKNFIFSQRNTVFRMFSNVFR